MPPSNTTFTWVVRATLPISIGQSLSGQSFSQFPHVIDLDKDDDDDQGKRLSTPPQVRNNIRTNVTAASIGLPVTKAGVIGSSSGIARAGVSTARTSTIMAGPHVSMVGPEIVRTSTGIQGQMQV